MIDDNSSFEIKRAFASFGGKCGYNCNHCYTYTDNFKSPESNSISDIIEELEKKDFNIVYISGFNENFIVPNIGIDLIEKIYNRFNCHILFTTRSVFDEKSMNRLKKINESMKKNNKILFACVSISAYDSYKKLEPNKNIPTPERRIQFVKKLYMSKIKTFLTVRPVCPNSFIPTSEYISILTKVNKQCTGVISSGIVVNNKILIKLKGFPLNFPSEEKPIMSCLEQDGIFVKYVDVKKELNIIKTFCTKNNISFYDESLEAIKNNIS